MAVTFGDIEKARQAMKGHVVRTPLLAGPKLSEITGAQIYVKFENLQVTNSFKDRGAFNTIASLSDAERRQQRGAFSAAQIKPLVTTWRHRPGARRRADVNLPGEVVCERCLQQRAADALMSRSRAG